MIHTQIIYSINILPIILHLLKNKNTQINHNHNHDSDDDDNDFNNMYFSNYVNELYIKVNI